MTKRQRRVEEEVKQSFHFHFFILHFQVRDLQDQVKGLQELVKGLQVHEDIFLLFEAVSFGFSHLKVTVGITAGLQDQLMDLQEKVRKMQVGLRG